MNGKSGALLPLEEKNDSPSVPIMGKLALKSILAELEQAMEQCRQLYLTSAVSGEVFQKPLSRQFAEDQERLHRGVLAKTYAAITVADGRWGKGEQRCAEVLLKHLGVEYSPDTFEHTARKLMRQALHLEWKRLLQPFREIPALRARTAELQTVISRVGNLVAKSDGVVKPEETAALQKILEEFWLHVRPDPHEQPARSAAFIEFGQGTAETAWEPPKPERRPKRPKADRGKMREQRLQQVEMLVGLQQVKQELCELADWALFQTQRRQAKLPHEPLALQFAFVGPAGTGKTLVATLLSDLMFASGGLKQGHVIETDGYELVSGDAHQAASKMKAILTQAMGGTVVINDAGAILLADNPSAVKALEVLDKNLAAHAERLAVVLSSEDPDRLFSVLDKHAGLAQQFRRRWHFDDYSTSELGQIFQRCCDRSQYRVTRLAQIKLLLGMHWCVHQDRRRFGNGHGVRGVFELAVQRLARRIAGVSPLTKELLTTFRDSDISISGVPARALGNLAETPRMFAVTCPGCAGVHLVGKDLLGIHVQCKSCHHRFLSAWGEPVD
jgi:hypothetical protein